MYVFCYFVFFFKQKTAYEMRISDWSSDVCSSDLRGHQLELEGADPPQPAAADGGAERARQARGPAAPDDDGDLLRAVAGRGRRRPEHDPHRRYRRLQPLYRLDRPRLCRRVRGVSNASARLSSTIPSQDTKTVLSVKKE